MLVRVYPRLLSKTHSGKSALASCAAYEYHQIGARMVADTYEMHGWRSWFIGANTPLDDLLDFIADKTPGVVTLSLTIYFNQDALFSMAERIRKQFPEVPILIGGQAFQQGGAERFERIAGVSHLPSLAELETWLASQGVHTG